VQRLTEDEEVEQIICHLPKMLAITPLRIGVEISGFARNYLRMRRKEEAARHASRVQRDLKAVVSQVDKIVEWASRHRRRQSIGIDRLCKAIEQLEELANGDSGEVVLGLPLDKEVVVVLNELRRALESVEADKNAHLDLSKTQNLRDFIRHLATQHIEEIRNGKTRRSRSAARELFSDRLACLYFELTGKRPTFTREKDRYELVSPFGNFAIAVFDFIEPKSIGPIPKQRVRFEDDIHGAVVRFSHEARWLKSRRGKNISPRAADPRDRKLARGRLRRGCQPKA
jgi:hypothetical protein